MSGFAGRLQDLSTLSCAAAHQKILLAVIFVNFEEEKMY